MTVRTYIPKLVAVLHFTCKYIAKYRETITKFLPEGGDAALTGIITACEVFMALVPNPLT